MTTNVYDLPAEELTIAVAERVMEWTLTNYETGNPVTSGEEYGDAMNSDGWVWEGRAGGQEAWQWEPMANLNHAFEITKPGWLWSTKEIDVATLAGRELHVEIRAEYGHTQLCSTSVWLQEDVIGSHCRARCICALWACGIKEI